ncbi:hypothetical protein LTR86_002512 [Recurvomyces mirabilis]|nr:hypothetical protein LTR86_002512 [Recurvomyces mirabilis]
MTETATSPHPHPFARPAKTPSAAATIPPSYFSTPRLSTPHQPTPTNPKPPSPNYFGFQAHDSSAHHADSPQHAKQNWSPPSSAVRSTAAASPSVVPVDQNPEYDDFRRQSEGKAFNLGGLSGNFKMNAPPRTKVGRTLSKPEKEAPKSPGHKPRDVPTHRIPSKESLDPSSAELARSPKRVLSPGSAAQVEPVRRGSPAHFKASDEDEPSNAARFKLPLDKMKNIPGFAHPPHRAETAPTGNVDESEADLMMTPQRLVTLLETRSEDILILDLRVSTQYATSHVSTALNLCIPTTLLKRTSYNAQKLAETFQEGPQRTKFEHWRTSKYIVVYDASSAQLKDAQICTNIIKKFEGEGYKGTIRILKGGFAGFSRSFPRDVESAASGPSGPQMGGDSERPGVAPVIGGCPMPLTDKPANPFFGNIRQNMDLIGGVGQIALKHPTTATDAVEDRNYPGWLRNAAEDHDQGKRVSTKFEAIERREKKRMEDALSGQVSYGSSTPHGGPKTPLERKLAIAGIEKGAKNRYNNIWPFEHSRVKLGGLPKSDCDYFNANYIKAAWSNKRYISTQAPIPATFADFWNVIWQQDIRVVVMLTAEKEGAQVKAHNYWSEKRYGPLHLEFLSEKRASLEPARIHNAQKKRPQPPKRTSTKSSLPGIPLAPIDSSQDKHSEQPYVTVRKFSLNHERYPFEPMREVTQLQYSSWPDFGAPAHPAHLLGLVEQTDAVVRASNKTHNSQNPDSDGERPIMVHCSAGCGRTGTFCTVDSVIDMLKRQRISQRERAGTEPMDIDERAPARPLHSGAKAAKIEKKSQQGGAAGGGEGSFFSSLLDPSAHQGESIDGPWVQSDDVDLVEKTVEDFRSQRISMVQSLRQFVLCYESVMEWLVDQSPVGEEVK